MHSLTSKESPQARLTWSGMSAEGEHQIRGTDFSEQYENIGIPGNTKWNLFVGAIYRQITLILNWIPSPVFALCALRNSSQTLLFYLSLCWVKQIPRTARENVKSSRRRTESNTTQISCLQISTLRIIFKAIPLTRSILLSTGREVDPATLKGTNSNWHSGRAVAGPKYKVEVTVNHPMTQQKPIALCHSGGGPPVVWVPCVRFQRAVTPSSIMYPRTKERKKDMAPDSCSEILLKTSDKACRRPEKKKTRNTLKYRSTTEGLGKPRTSRVIKLLAAVKGSRSIWCQNFLPNTCQYQINITEDPADLPPEVP